VYKLADFRDASTESDKVSWTYEYVAQMLVVEQFKSNQIYLQIKTQNVLSPIIGPIPWGHNGPLCRALSLSSWTSMRRRRATVPVATSGEWAYNVLMCL